MNFKCRLIETLQKYFDKVEKHGKQIIQKQQFKYFCIKRKKNSFFKTVRVWFFCIFFNNMQKIKNNWKK